MAGEDIQITVGVSGNRDIKTLNDNVSKVEASVKKLAAGLDSGRISSSAFEKAITQQSDKLKKLKFSQDEASNAVDTWAIISLDAIAAEKASSKAKQEAIAALKAEKLARKGASDAAKLDKIAKQEAALAAKQETTTVKLLADTERDLQDARKQIIASTQQEAAVVDQLKSKYQAGYRELKLYQAENEQLNLAYKKNILTADQLRAEQDKLSASFAKGTGMFSTYAQQLRSKTSQIGVVAQQAGYQFGDFFVQIQSGTNPMVAFGQQATQLVGTFAMLSKSMKWISIFSGLGVAIPIITAIAAAWLRSSENNNKATESLKAYKQAQDDVAAAIVTSQQKLDKLTFGVDETYQAEILKEQIRLREEFNKKDVEYNNYLAANRGKETDLINMTIAGMRNGLEGIKKVYEENNKLLETQNRLSAAYTLMQNVRRTTEKSNEEYLKRQAEYLQQQVDKGIAIYNAMMAREKGYRQQTKYAEDLSKAVTKALQDGTDLSKLDIGKGIVAASVAAETLAKNLGISLAAATKMVALSANTPAENLAALKFKNTPAYNSLNTNPSVQGLTIRPVPDRFTPEPKKTDTGPVAGKIDTQEEYLAKLVREYDMKKKSVGMTDQQIKRNEFIFTLDEKIATMKSKVSETEIEALRKQSIAAYDLYQAAEKQAAIMDRVTSSLETMFMSFVDGTKSVGDAFKGMLRDIIMQIYQEKVAKQAASGISNFFSGLASGATGGINIGGSGSLFGGASWSANGNIVAGSGIQAFANGGVVGSPTMFQHGGGLGVMGEAGPEAIMPLKRDKNGRLGVSIDGGSGAVNVVNNINVTGGTDPAAIRMEVAKLLPKITESTKAAVLDAKRRGGAYSRGMS